MPSPVDAAAGHARLRALVVVRRVEEAEARGRLRAAEVSEAALGVEVARWAEAVRRAVARLEQARPVSARELAGAGPAPRRAAALLLEERWRASLRDEHTRQVEAHAAAEQRRMVAHREREVARQQVAEAVKRRQGAEAEVRRRRSEARRGRERREEAAAADTLLGRGPRR